MTRRQKKSRKKKERHLVALRKQTVKRVRKFMRALETYAEVFDRAVDALEKIEKESLKHARYPRTK